MSWKPEIQNIIYASVVNQQMLTDETCPVIYIHIHVHVLVSFALHIFTPTSMVLLVQFRQLLYFIGILVKNPDDDSKIGRNI